MSVLTAQVFTYPWDRKKPHKHSMPFADLNDPQFISKLRTDNLPPLLAIGPPQFLTPLM